MRRSVGRILKTDMREHRNDGRLRQCRHRERQISFGDPELSERVHDRDESRFGKTRAGADHVCLGDADFDEPIRQALLKQADAGGPLHVGGNGINRQPFLRRANRCLGQAGLYFILFHRRRRRRAGGGFGGPGRFLLFPIQPQGLCPIQKFLRRLAPVVNLDDPVNDLFAVGQRKTVASRRIRLGVLDPVTLDRFRQQADRLCRIGHRRRDSPLDCGKNGLQIVAVGDGDHVPAQRAHGRERQLHREGVFGYAAGQFCVVVRNNQHIGIDAALPRQTGNGRERFFRLALHRRAVADSANRHAIAPGDFVRDGQPLGLGQGGTERAVAKKNALRIQMRFAVAGQFALDAAKGFEVFKTHPVKSIVGAQRVDAIFCVARIVDEVERFMPLASLDGKHDPVNRRHDFCESGRSTPVTGCAAIDRVHVHQCHQRPSRARIAQNHLLPGGVFDFDEIFREATRRGGESGFDIQRSQGRHLDLFNHGLVFGHK